MSGKRAKAMRKAVYGDDLSPKHREYRRKTETTKNGAQKPRQIMSDHRRWAYQQLKKEKRGKK